MAGVEATFTLLNNGYGVRLYEMRPKVQTPAHKTGAFAELVCSNSLKSNDIDTSQGLLKAEMRALGSVCLTAAEVAKVPAGGALAVDRNVFSEKIKEILFSYPNFELVNEEVTELLPNSIIATGPLTSDKLSAAIGKHTGENAFHFYDAVAPIIEADSVDMSRAFFGARYGKGEPTDYLNCPMNKEEYLEFYHAMIGAERVVLHEFEKGEIFENCMPVEVLASRGEDTMRFGPLKPVGLRDASGNRAYAVVQLRREDNYDKLMNLVGFQTNLTFPEQRRVFGLIPALKNAEFVRYGVMHRNSYINSPTVLNPNLSMKGFDNTFFAGQLTGVEGYMESAASGIIAANNLMRALEEKPPMVLPQTTMIGSLISYITDTQTGFSPMHVSFSLVPPLDNPPRDKQQRKHAYSERAISDLALFLK